MANNIGEANRDIRQASFINCVITGYADDVIMGSIVEGQDYTCPYLFSHCLLNTIKSDDSVRFVHIRKRTSCSSTPTTSCMISPPTA